jgi:integrase
MRRTNRLTQAMVDRATPKEVIVPLSDRGFQTVRRLAQTHPGLSRAEPLIKGAARVIRNGKVVIVRYKHTVLNDGLGLLLQVSRGDAGPNGEEGPIRRSFIYRFSVAEKITSKNGKVRQRQRWCGIGSADVLSLPQAREVAQKMRLMRLVDGQDPVQVKHGARVEAAVKAAKAMTFDEARDSYIADHGAKWKSQRHARIWVQSLERFVTPVFGRLPVAAVDRELVIKALRPLMHDHPETGHRVRQRIEVVLAWAAANGKRSRLEANPAQWKDVLQFVFPRRKDVAPVIHMKAIPWKELPEFMGRLREIDGTAALALTWTVLTGARTGSVHQMEWREISEVDRVWTIPASHMKRGNALRIPIPDDAMAVLAKLDRDGKHVFPIGPDAMRRVCEKVRADTHVHGMRSAFADWATWSGHERDLIDEQLGHLVGNPVSRAYRQTEDWLERRRAMMERFASFCAGRMVDDNKVVALRG